MNYEQKLEKIREDLNQARNIKTRSEIALENLEREEKELVDQLKDLGVEPENLDEEIKTLEKDIEKLLDQAEQMIPHDILEKVKNK